MATEFATAYLGIMFLNFFYLIVLLYGGMWYTNQRTVTCPRCGVKYSKYRIEDHECHPSLVEERPEKPWHNYGN